MFGDFNKGANKGDYFGTKEPWVKHLSSSREFRWSNSLDLVTAEDLIEGPPIGIDDETQEVAFHIMPVGCPRTPVGVFIMRHDPMTGELFTRVESY